MFKKIISLFLSLSLIITQPIFAQGVAQLNLAQYLGQMPALIADKFRPLHLRYFSYDGFNDRADILLDKGDEKELKENEFKKRTDKLLEYFKIGLSLPSDKFWVNLRPDAPDQIIDPELEQTDMGQVMLEADLELKKDTARFTSPQTVQGKEYWDKLYKRAGELFGTENITIPTITRPWIVPGEIILREDAASAYVFKANMKVLLEQDHLKGSVVYDFKDPRMKELNEYSSQLIRELILPTLTQEVNTAKRYARLRQVFFSLILSRWFKDRFSPERIKGESGAYPNLIDSHNLAGLTSKESWSKDTYYQAYRKSFQEGEYNLKEQVSTPSGQVIRSYVSGGEKLTFTAGDMSSFKNPSVSSPLSKGFKKALKEMGAMAIVVTVLGFFAWSMNMVDIAKDRRYINQRPKSMLPYEIGSMPDKIKLNSADKIIEDILENSYSNTINALGDLDKNIAVRYNSLWVQHNNNLYQMLYNGMKGQSPDNVRHMVALTGILIKNLTQDRSASKFILVFPEDVSSKKDLTDQSAAIVVKELIRAREAILLMLSRIASEVEQNWQVKTEGYYKGISLVFDYFYNGVDTEEQQEAYRKINDFLNSLHSQENGEFIKHDLKTDNNREQFLVNIAEFLEKNNPPGNKAPILEEIIKQIISDTRGFIVKTGSSPLALDEKRKIILGLCAKYKKLIDPIDLEKLKKDAGNIKDEVSLGKFLSEALSLLGGYLRKTAKGIYGLSLIRVPRFFHGVNNYIDLLGFHGELLKLYLSELRDRNPVPKPQAMPPTLNANEIAGPSSPESTGKTKSASSIEQEVGGIDFRQINYLIQPAGSFKGLNYNLPQLSSSALERIDVDKELGAIRRMASNGIISSGDRLKELLAACFQKKVIADKQDELAACVLVIGRLYEDKVLETPAWIREALVIVDTGKYALSSGKSYSPN